MVFDELRGALRKQKACPKMRQAQWINDPCSDRKRDMGGTGSVRSVGEWLRGQDTDDTEIVPPFYR